MVGIIAIFCDVYPDATVTIRYKCYKCYKLAQTSSENKGFYRKEMNMLQFQNTISYADLVIFVLLVIAFIGIFLVRRQVMQSKATFFKELYLLVFADPDISDAFYLLETRQFVYGETLGHSP